MSIWNDFATLIGVAPRHAEAALYSELAARASLSRRSMFGASAALAAGVVFGFPAVRANPFADLTRLYRVDAEVATRLLNGELYDVFEFPLPAGKILYFDTDSCFVEVLRAT